MNVLEARRTRHLIIRFDRGEELPAALLRALDEAEARSGWIAGTGSLETAELALPDHASRDLARPRRIEGPCDVVALSGNVARLDGETSLRLSATLARESDVGLQLAAGELVWARVHGLELHVTAFDDLSLTRTADDRAGQKHLAAPSIPPAAPPAAPIEPNRAAPSPSVAPAAEAFSSSGAPLPQRPARPRQEEEMIYPEAGDNVTHFHFGECVVISSDGERIRLRQDRDGRVREVSLTMLRIEVPTVDPATGKRHFRLARKN